MPPRADADVAVIAMGTLSDIRDTAQDKVVSDRVVTRLAQLPTLLCTSGLLATLAFYAAKGVGDRDLDKAYAVVGSVLRAQSCVALGWREDGGQAIDLAFLKRLTEEVQKHPESLTRVTLRLQELSIWLRRLAEALDGEQQRNRSAKESADG